MLFLNLLKIELGLGLGSKLRKSTNFDHISNRWELTYTRLENELNWFNVQYVGGFLYNFFINCKTKGGREACLIFFFAAEILKSIKTACTHIREFKIC